MHNNNELLTLGAIYENIIDAAFYVIGDEILTVICDDSSFYSILGYKKEEYNQILENSLINSIFAPDSRRFIEQLNVLKEGVLETDIRLINRKAGVIWYNIKVILTGNDELNRPIYFCVLNNIAEQKKMMNDYETQSRFMELVEKSIDGGTVICFDDKKMSLAYIGKDLLKFLGYSSDETDSFSKGSFYSLIAEGDREEVEDTLAAWFKTGNYYEIEFRLKKRDGSLVWVVCKGNRIKNENGDNVLVSLILDINNTRLIVEKLEKANKNLRAMQNSIPGYFGKFAILENGFEILSINEQLMELFSRYHSEVKSTKIMPFEAFSINKLLINEIAIRKEKSIELEVSHDNRWYMIRGTYENEKNTNNHPVYYIMFTDITSQKDIQMQAEIQKEKYQKITEISDDIIFEYDCVADIMIYSEKYKQVVDRPAMVFNFRKELEFEKDEPGYIDFSTVFDTIFLEKNFYRNEHCIKLPDNKDFWLEISAKGIQNDNGDIVKIIGVLRDIDKQKKEQILLYDKSRIDLLSGLYNKISTQEEIVLGIEKLNAGMYSALMMVDIDDFKSVNDVYGHISGDEVIKKIADYLREVFPDSVIGRVGGDEFQVFMYNILDEKIVAEKAKKICDGVADIFRDSPLNVTVSIGVFCTNRRLTYDSIYQKADIALYNAKAKGKNRFELYGKQSEDKHANVDSRASFEHNHINSPSFSVRQFNQNLIAFKKNKEGLLEALAIIGEEIGLDRIIINQIDQNNNTYSTTYEWYDNSLKSIASLHQDVSMEDYAVFNDNDKDVQAYYYDDTEWYTTQQKMFFKLSGFKSIIQIPLIVEEKIYGYVEYIRVNDDKMFTSNQLSSLVNISISINNFIYNEISKRRIITLGVKILNFTNNKCESFYIVHTDNEHYERYILTKEKIEYLDKGDDYFKTKFVADASLIVDEEDKKRFVQIFSKENVKKVFENNRKELISFDYKVETVGKTRYFRKVAFLLSEKFDIKSYITFAQYDISEEVLAKEKLRKEKIEILKEKVATESIFDEIIEYNVQEQKIDVLYTSQDSIIKYVSLNENFDVSFKYMLDEFVYEDDKELVADALKIENLEKHFENNSLPLMLYYRRNSHSGKQNWIRLFVSDVSNAVGYKSYIAMFRNDEEYDKQKDITSKLTLMNNQLVINQDLEIQKSKIDSLTGIYNINEFNKCCTKLFKTEKEYKLAVVRMDIDKFKLINDLYGYDIGDDILKHTANVIKNNIINNGIYGRMNSDIFCMCVRFKHTDEIVGMIDRIVSAITLYDAKYRISSYFGICVIEDRTVDIGVICDWANIALKKVKGSTLNRYAFYDNNMRMNLLDEIKFESQMEYALESGQFEAYLQPQYDIRTSKINGAEALIRWNHPVEGVISPGRFIPLFERNGFVTKVDEFIWRQACAILRKWIDDGYKPVPISVNVSRLHMFDDNLCDKIIALLNEYSLPRHLLVLEVTETVMYDDSEAMNRMLNKMRNMGFQIAMDDFGSGYSSLNMLENMCLDELKIDRAFLTRASSTENGKVIVKFIISLARQLNLKVVAEGVESVEQAAMLCEFGCYNAQGYYYSRPVPINKFESQAFNVNMQKEIPECIKEILKKERVD